MYAPHQHWPEDRADGATVCGTCGELWNGRDRCDACGHDGYDGHDMTATPPRCYTCGCGHPAADTVEPIVSAALELASAGQYDDRRDALRVFERATLHAVGSIVADDEYRMGRMDFDELDEERARTHAGAVELVQLLREAFSSCPGHATRDDDCAECLALPDLNLPDNERPGPDAPADPAPSWHPGIAPADRDERRERLDVDCSRLAEVRWWVALRGERDILTPARMVELAGFRAWPGDIAADYDASTERFELSPSGRWGGVRGALPPVYLIGWHEINEHRHDDRRGACCDILDDELAARTCNGHRPGELCR
jgi:hypothetical protein